MGQIIFQKSSTLDGQSSQLQRLSVSKRLEQQQKGFEVLTSEFERVMRYRFSQLETVRATLQTRLQHQIVFLMQQKIGRLEFVKEQLLSNNPRNRAKEGWAKVYKNGAKSTLEAIETDEIFFLEDKSTKIEAICKKKLTFWLQLK